MSYHHEFHLAEDEFLEEVDNQEQFDGAGGADDVALDEYEMVYLFIYFDFAPSLLLDFCINFGGIVLVLIGDFDWNSLLR